MKPRLLLPLALVALTTTASACTIPVRDLMDRYWFKSADTPVAQPGMDELNACNLFSKEEAQTILGSNVNDPQRSATRFGQVTVTSCIYTTSSTEEGTDPEKIKLIFQQFASTDEARRNYQAARDQSENIAGVKPEEIADLGESAYWSGGTENRLGVYKGLRWYEIQALVKNNPKEAALTAMKATIPQEEPKK